jgi:hypothetical protein
MERLTLRVLNKQLRVLKFVRSLQTTLYLNFSANGISNLSARFLFLGHIIYLFIYSFIYSRKAAAKCSLLPPNVYPSDDRHHKVLSLNTGAIFIPPCRRKCFAMNDYTVNLHFRSNVCFEKVTLCKQ